MTFVHRTWRLGIPATALLLATVAITPVLAATSAVSIVDKTFEPVDVTVNQGDTVTWTVTKAVDEPHTVTSGTPSATDSGSVFDSRADDPEMAGLTEQGGSFSFTFETTGTFDYFCVVHPTEMTGKITVVAAGEGPGEPPGEAHAPVPPERKLLGGVILAVTLVVLFGAAWFWRRLNPA